MDSRGLQRNLIHRADFWRCVLASGLLVCAHGHAADGTSAIERFGLFQSELANDKKAADWEAFLAAARRQMAFLNGSPASGLEVARAELQLGHRDTASLQVRRVAIMGQTNEILSTPLFQPLRATIDRQLVANQHAVSRARPTFRVDDPGLLPEDIDYDPVTRRFLVTSVRNQTIVTWDANHRQTIFAEAPDHWPMVALKVDAKRRRVWATEVAFDGFTTVPQTDWGRSAVLEFDLDRGTLLPRKEGPPHSGLGDMTLAKNGDPIVSDGDGGGVYRLHSDELTRIDHGDFISPQTVAICPDSRHVFVPDYVRGVAAFDIDSGAVRWLSTKDRFALDGVDGLYCRNGQLIAVQNGTTPVRVIIFRLDQYYGSIIAEDLVERSTPTLGVPTHGVLVGPTFFYIANSGWDGLDDHGTTKSAAPMSPAVIMGARLF